MDIVTFFPRLPLSLVGALTKLEKKAIPIPNESPDAAAVRLGELADLPRPWIPGSCDPELRHDLYRWLDDVAAWLNDQYSWQPKTMIPACWPRHPHIAHELAVLAMLRHQAEQEISPVPLNEWHRYSRPLFIERMLDQLDEGCRTNHATWPGRARFNDYRSARGDRLDIYGADAADAD